MGFLTPRSTLSESTHDLRRALRAVHACSADEPDEDLLAHVTEALSRLDQALLVAASKLVNVGDDRAGGAEAEALRWHLMETARRSRAAAATCHEAKRWARACVSASPRTTASAGI
jgi:hypothetical protein